jgi:DNA-binding response OmpR family regulator
MPRQIIYIVDDDPAAALITQRGLQALLDSRLTVRIAATPDTAWLACARSEVDLLIIDPGQHSGAASALMRAVRAFRPSIPLLVLTAYDTPGMRANVRDLGIAFYAAKPIDLQDLLPIVRAALPAPAAAALLAGCLH